MMASRFLKQRCFAFCCGIVVMMIIATYELQRRNSAKQNLCPSGSNENQHQQQAAEQVSIRKNDLVAFSRMKVNPFEETIHWKTFTKALEEYKVFHRMKLQQLKSLPSDKTVKTLTWACTHKRCSGIGDQLLRSQYFLLLAMMSDRLFTIYWDKELQQVTKHIIPNEIDWTYFNRSIGMCDYFEHRCHHVAFESTSIWGFGWNTNDFTHFGQVLFGKEQHITITGTVFMDVMTIGKSYVNQGELIENGLKKLGVEQLLREKCNDTVHADYRPLFYTLFHKLGIHHLMEISDVSDGKSQATNAWLYISHMIFTYLFGFSRSLVSEAAKYQKSLGLYDQDYLAIHLRTGFMGTKDEESFMMRYQFNGLKLFTDPKHWRCIIQHGIDLRDKTMGSNASIYLSTDSYLVKDMVLKEFGDKRIFFGDIKLIHSRKEHRQCEMSGNKATWLDFFTLANASRFVHAKSAFAVASSLLKPIPHSSHSWTMNDDDRGCLVSKIAGSTNCICS